MIQKGIKYIKKINASSVDLFQHIDANLMLTT